MSKNGISFKWIFLIILSILLLIIIMQNMGTCNVKLLFVRIENVPIFVLIAASVLAGMAIGIVFTFLSFRKIRKTEKEKAKEQEKNP